MTTNTNRLYRSRDGIVAGVCGGIADFFGLDAFLLWLIIPKAPQQ